MAEEQKQEQANPWGEKTQEQLWNDYQAAQQAAESYKTALGGIDAEQAKQGWEWARGVAKEIQEGRLTYAQQKAIDDATKDQTKPPVDEFGLPTNYDELTPREQALIITKQIQEGNKTYLAEMVKAQRAEVEGQLKDWMGRTDQEKSLLFQVLEASRVNPKLDVKAALEKAAQLKAASPDKLLQMAIENMSAPDPNANFDEKVAAAVAEKLQEAENKRLEAAFGISGVRRKVSLKKTPRGREEVNREIMKKFTSAGFTA